MDDVVIGAEVHAGYPVKLGDSELVGFYYYSSGPVNVPLKEAASQDCRGDRAKLAYFV
jgi:hypothetical protein